MSRYGRMAEITRKATLTCLVLLLLILVLDTLIMPSGGRSANPVVWFAFSLPLLILVPGVLRGSWKSFAWLGFVSMLYFAQAVIALFSPLLRPLDILQLLVSIALFIGALLFVRWRARANRVAEMQ